MTGSEIWTWVRWPLAVLALLLVVRYAAPRAIDAIQGTISFQTEEGSLFGLDSEPTEEPAFTPPPTVEPTVAALEPPEGGVEDGAAAAVTDFAVTDTTVGQLDSDTLVLSDAPEDLVVVAFELIDGSPACLDSLRLTLRLEDATVQTELGAFPASIPDVRSVERSQQLAGASADLLLSDDPGAIALGATAGRLEFDVLPLYQTYFTYDLPAGSPFVVAIAATSDVPQQGSVTFAATEDPRDNGPRLSWVGAADCA